MAVTIMTARSGAALLFDIDGTLVDTDALHRQAFNRVFAPYGHVFDHQRYGKELQGFSNASIMQRFLSDESADRKAAIMAEKERIFRDLAVSELRPMPGLLALLDRADQMGLPMAAVTNAPRLNAKMLLRGIGVANRFRAVIIGDELAHGKPHPLPYLEGLRRLDADASRSVAFEDSRSGICSATDAGVATIGLMTGLTRDDMIAAGAVAAVGDFNDPQVMELIAQKVN